MTGGKALEPQIETSGSKGGRRGLLVSLFPILFALFVFAVLVSAEGSGIYLFDVGTWPGGDVYACDHVNPQKCSNFGSFYSLLRIVTMCAALLPLLGSLGYIPAVMKVVKQGRAETGSVEILLYLAWLGLFINTIWIVNIYFGYSHVGDSSAITVSDKFILGMFLVYLLIDLGLMRLHDATAGGPREAEFDFFFGNAFFIDIPTLCGVGCIIAFSSMIISALGQVPAEVTEAVSGAAVVMHVVISQVVFAFLLFQMKLKRGTTKGPASGTATLAPPLISPAPPAPPPSGKGRSRGTKPAAAKFAQ